MTYVRKHKLSPCRQCGATIKAIRCDKSCAACRKAYQTKWNAEHKEYYKNFPRDPEKEKARAKKYRDVHKVEAREYFKKYHADRPGVKTLWDANRRATKKQATPKWANLFFIAEAYSLAKLRERVCGGKWHVDHLIPLQSKRVCGLHVEHNLRVIPESENMRKSNQRWPNM